MRPGVEEDASGKGRVARLVQRRAPLRRESSDSTSDTTPFCVTRRPIDKTSLANLHIGGASVACSGTTINLSALHIVNASQRFVFPQNVRYSAKLIHFRQND